jgi:predicted ATPase
LAPSVQLAVLSISSVRNSAMTAARSGLVELETVREAFETIERTGTRFNKAEILRLKGELLLLDKNEPRAEAVSCFREAIKLARHQSAKSWELRATTSLARLLAAQDRCEEARAMLADIYNWFTEGFDTVDLKDAKALLDELSA